MGWIAYEQDTMSNESRPITFFCVAPFACIPHFHIECIVVATRQTGKQANRQTDTEGRSSSRSGSSSVVSFSLVGGSSQSEKPRWKGRENLFSSTLKPWLFFFFVFFFLVGSSARFLSVSNSSRSCEKQLESSTVVFDPIMSASFLIKAPQDKPSLGLNHQDEAIEFARRSKTTFPTFSFCLQPPQPPPARRFRRNRPDSMTSQFATFKVHRCTRLLVVDPFIERLKKLAFRRKDVRRVCCH